MLRLLTLALSYPPFHETEANPSSNLLACEIKGLLDVVVVVESVLGCVSPPGSPRGGGNYYHHYNRLQRLFSRRTDGRMDGKRVAFRSLCSLLLLLYCYFAEKEKDFYALCGLIFLSEKGRVERGERMGF